MDKNNVDSFIAGISAQVDQQVNEMCAKKGQMSLGELVARLEAANPNAIVRFEDGTYPRDFDSYRGYYRFVAVDHGPECTVAQFLSKTKQAIGATFVGYKGGEFTMTKFTPVWVSEYGRASGIGIVDVQSSDKEVVLRTALIDDLYE